MEDCLQKWCGVSEYRAQAKTSNKGKMVIYKETIKLITSHRDELVDITRQVQSVIRKSGIKDGICYVFCPHTTAGLTVNENADPTVKNDIIRALEEMIPSIPFHHAEGNSPAHIKASMMGFSLQLLVQENVLLLGTWQGVYFCEFDGPRNREIHAQIFC